MNIQIIKNTKIWLVISTIVVIVALVGLFGVKLNLGIDFTGGNIFQFKFENTVDLKEFETNLNEFAKENKIIQFNAEKRRVQSSEGNVIIIRTPEINDAQKKEFLSFLNTKYEKLEIMKIDKVGSTIGNELKGNAFNALLIGSLLIIIYITIRFEFKYAIAAIVALLHDVIIAAGLLAFFKLEVNTPFIAAMLTILGYSINDTLVVFDRIRENTKKKTEKELPEIIDLSINQTMTRSINTSLTTFFAVLCIFLFGGASLKTFITTLMIGVISGTYSSIFVASPLLNLLPSKKVVEEESN